jgi:diguanylate cyclase (GGDEF)-like protein
MTNQLAELLTNVSVTDARYDAVCTMIEGMLSDDDRAVFQRGNSHLRKAATTDLRTGLLNARGFLPQLIEAVEHTKQPGYRHDTVLFALDVDHLKMLNDNVGHADGHEALRYVGKEFKQHFKQRDIIARTGGDEFHALLFNWSKAHQGDLKERVAAFISAYHTTMEKLYGEFGTSLSIGVLRLNPEWDIFETFEHSDEALYHAKSTKNHYESWDARRNYTPYLPEIHRRKSKPL